VSVGTGDSFATPDAEAGPPVSVVASGGDTPIIYLLLLKVCGEKGGVSMAAAQMIVACRVPVGSEPIHPQSQYSQRCALLLALVKADYKKASVLGLSQGVGWCQFSCLCLYRFC